MREGGTRRIVVPPGRLQQQGTKSLVWIAGLLDALEDAGGEEGGCDAAAGQYPASIFLHDGQCKLAFARAIQLVCIP